MGVRETLNSHQRITVAAALVIVVVAIGASVWTLTSSGGQFSGEKLWYSDDDGKTWFKDDPHKITPFDHNGKPAVMCFVYTNGTKTWAAFLMRHPAGWKEKIEAAEKNGMKNPRDSVAFASPLMEVKRPGDKDWVPANGPSGDAILDPRNIRAPDGTTKNVTPVGP